MTIPKRTMKAFDPEPLTIEVYSDTKPNQRELDDALHDAMSEVIGVARFLFGEASCRMVAEDLDWRMSDALRRFAHSVASAVSSAHLEQTLKDSRQATATMFEAMAAGAFATSRAAEHGGQEAADGIAEGFAIVSGLEGRMMPLEALKTARTTGRGKP